MPEENDLILDLGVQGDGEPAVTEPLPVEETVENPEEPAETQETKPEGDEKPHKKPGSQRARERAQRLEQENEQLRRMLLDQRQPEAQRPAPVVQASAGKPKAEDFSSHEDWVEAVAEWKAGEILRNREVQEAQRKQKESLDAIVAKGREKYEDFDLDFQEILRAPVLSQTVAEAIQESDVSPDLVHHFADNPEDLRRISLMSPLKAAREITKLEQSFSEQTKTETPKQQATKAPKPPIPVTTGATAKPAADGFYVY